jgi:hypothetical protein
MATAVDGVGLVWVVGSAPEPEPEPEPEPADDGDVAEVVSPDTSAWRAVSCAPIPDRADAFAAP